MNGDASDKGASSGRAQRVASVAMARNQSPVPVMTSFSSRQQGQRFPSSPRGWNSSPKGGSSSPMRQSRDLGDAGSFNLGPSGSSSSGAAGTVTLERTKLLRETSQQQEAALADLQIEQRRLIALRKEVADMLRQNEELRLQLGASDVRGLREVNAQVLAQVDEVAKLQATAATLQAVISRREALQAEVDALQPAVANAQALEQELRELRNVDARRDGLRKEIVALQPKIDIVNKMKRQLAQLHSDVEEVGTLQAQVAAMSAQAEKLPALKVLHAKKQASSAEARKLEQALAELEKQEAQYEELAARLPVLQAKVADFEELKTRVDGAQEAARVAEALSARLAELRRTAELLPTLQAEHARLVDAAAEAQTLDKLVTALMPAAAQLQSVKYQHQQLTNAVAEVAALQARVHELKDVEAQRAALHRQLDELGARDEGASYADVRGMERSISYRLAPGQAPPPLGPPALQALKQRSAGRHVSHELLAVAEGGSGAASAQASAPGSPLSTANAETAVARAPAPAQAPVASAPPPQAPFTEEAMAAPGTTHLSQRQQAVDALKSQLQALTPPSGLPPVPKRRSSTSGFAGESGNSSSGGAGAPRSAAGSAGGVQPAKSLSPEAHALQAAAVPAAAVPPPPPARPMLPSFPPTAMEPPAMSGGLPGQVDMSSLHEAAEMLLDLEQQRRALYEQLDALGPEAANSTPAISVRKLIDDLEEQISLLQAAASELVQVEEATADFVEQSAAANSMGSAGEEGGDGAGMREGSGTLVASLRDKFSTAGNISLADITPRVTAVEEHKVRVYEAENARLHTSAALLPHLIREHERLTTEVQEVRSLEARVAELQALSARLPELQAAASSPVLLARAAAAAELCNPGGARAAGLPGPPPGYDGSAESLAHQSAVHVSHMSLEERRDRYEELEPLEAEAVMLADEINRLTPLTGVIGMVRAEHARLLALVHEQSRMQADSEVLALQLEVMEGSSRMTVEETPNGDSPAPAQAERLSEIFQRLRDLTAENLDLTAENDELRAEISDLRNRFATSAAAINKLKTLANAVDMIRKVGRQHLPRNCSSNTSSAGGNGAL